MANYDIPTALDLVVKNILDESRRQPTLVLVAGGSCSGKSYFSKNLQARLHDLGITSTIVHQDDYFRDIDDPEIPRGNDSRPVFDIPNAYRNEELRQDVDALLRGKNVTGPIYDISTNKRVNSLQMLNSSKVIIVDGLFAITQFGSYPKAIRIFVDASRGVRMDRRVTRDQKYGVPRDVIEAFFLKKVEPNHKQFVETQKLSADILITNEWR